MECDSMVGELSAVLGKAEERAAERELRMRKMELEMVAKMREREDLREEHMFGMFNNIIMQLMGGSGPVPVPPFAYQPNPQPLFAQHSLFQEASHHFARSSTPRLPHSHASLFPPIDED